MEMSTSDKSNNKEAQQLYLVYDKNKDGNIDGEELNRLINDMSNTRNQLYLFRTAFYISMSITIVLLITLIALVTIMLPNTQNKVLVHNGEAVVATNKHPVGNVSLIDNTIGNRRRLSVNGIATVSCKRMHQITITGNGQNIVDDEYTFQLPLSSSQYGKTRIMKARYNEFTYSATELSIPSVPIVSPKNQTLITIVDVTCILEDGKCVDSKDDCIVKEGTMNRARRRRLLQSMSDT